MNDEGIRLVLDENKSKATKSRAYIMHRPILFLTSTSVLHRFILVSPRLQKHFQYFGHKMAREYEHDKRIRAQTVIVHAKYILFHTTHLRISSLEMSINMH